MVTGAFNITKEAEVRSREAQSLVDATAPLLAESERVRLHTEKLLSEKQSEFDAQVYRNRKALDSLDDGVVELTGKLSSINGLVRQLLLL